MDFGVAKMPFIVILFIAFIKPCFSSYNYDIITYTKNASLNLTQVYLFISF